MSGAMTGAGAAMLVLAALLTYGLFIHCMVNDPTKKTVLWCSAAVAVLAIVGGALVGYTP